MILKEYSLILNILLLWFFIPILKILIIYNVSLVMNVQGSKIYLSIINLLMLQSKMDLVEYEHKRLT